MTYCKEEGVSAVGIGTTKFEGSESIVNRKKQQKN